MKTLRLQTFILIFLSFTLGFSEFMVNGLMNDLASQFKVGVGQIGYLVTIFALTYSVSTPIITTLTGKAPLFKVLIILMVSFTIGNFITMFAFNYIILAISRIIVATSSGASISIAMTFANYLAPRQRRGEMIAGIYSGFSVASVLGLPAGIWISSHSNWRVTFGTVTVFSIICLTALFFSLPHDLKVQNKGKSIVSQLSLFKDRRILISISIIIFCIAGYQTFYTYLRPILSNNLHFSIADITFLLTIYGIGTFISNQASGKIASKKGLKAMPPLFAIEFLVLASLPLTLLIPWVGIISIILLSLLSSLINSPIQLYILETSEKDYPQSMVLASSLNAIFTNIGISIGSATGGVVSSSIGTGDIGSIGSIYIIITIIVTIILNKLNQNNISQKKETT